MSDATAAARTGAARPGRAISRRRSATSSARDRRRRRDGARRRSLALLWANSPAWHSYESVWTTTLAIRIGGAGISADLRHWVNEGLMTFFFLVVGLEAKREFDLGELRERRRLAIPVMARARRHRRAGRDLPRVQRRRPGRARLGRGDVDRQRVRARRARAADAALGDAAARLPAHAVGRRRPLRAARDRGRLHLARLARRARGRDRAVRGCSRCATRRVGAPRRSRSRVASRSGSRCSSPASTR